MLFSSQSWLAELRVGVVVLQIPSRAEFHCTGGSKLESGGVGVTLPGARGPELLQCACLAGSGLAHRMEVINVKAQQKAGDGELSFHGREVTVTVPPKISQFSCALIT